MCKFTSADYKLGIPVQICGLY